MIKTNVLFINQDRDYEEILIEELNKPILISIKESTEKLRDTDVIRL